MMEAASYVEAQHYAKSCLHKCSMAPLRLVSVAQENKPSTLSSSNVQSIDLPTGQIIIIQQGVMSQKCLIFLYKVHPHVKWPEKKT